MFECVARPRYIPGHGWVTMENADTANLGDEALQAALLHKAALQRADAAARAESAETAGHATAQTNPHQEEHPLNGSGRSRRDSQLPRGDRRRLGDLPH